MFKHLILNAEKYEVSFMLWNPYSDLFFFTNENTSKLFYREFCFFFFFFKSHLCHSGNAFVQKTQVLMFESFTKIGFHGSG